MKTKKDFIRTDWQTYIPKYKAYCKSMAVEKVTLVTYIATICDKK